MASLLPEQSENKPGSWSVENESDMWRAFVGAQSDEVFCQAWLALLCRQLPDIKAGVVLYRSAQANTFLPIAVWPEVTRDLSFLGKVAERALTERRGVVHRPDETGDAPIHLAYPIEVSQRVLGSVVLEAAPRSDTEVHALLRQLHWSIAWLYDLSRRHEQALAELSAERVGSVMEVVATALRQQRLQQILFDVANQVARHLRCARVAIGLTKHHSIRVAALSDAAWFEKNAGITKLYVAAMEEAYDRQAPFNHPDESSNDIEPNTAHGRLARESGANIILSVPLQRDAECLGVLTLERTTEEPFSQHDREWLEALIGLLPAVIQQKQLSERSYTTRIREDLKKLSARLFGPKHLTWKFSAGTALVVLAILMLVKIDYRVSAKMIIEGELQRAAVAPFASFVSASYVRPGDIVREGQVLVALDDNDLKLEQHRWRSEYDQASRKLREAMAKHDLSSYQVLSAQQQQAEAQLALADERLARAKVIAPFDGVIISGDLSQLIGSPVEQGKKLFEIAPLESYRVILQVDERDMRHVQMGQSGKLVISGITDDPIPFSVSRITPVATAQDGRNFFRIEAKLSHTPANLRPGMEGIGKVTTEEQRLWWVLTHRFTDWLRLTLWNWLP